MLTAYAKIGDHVESGDVVAAVDSAKVVSEISGVLRGLHHEGLRVTKGLKLGDVDPRNDVSACYTVSDKALAIGGGVLEAVLSKKEIREQLWDQG